MSEAGESESPIHQWALETFTESVQADVEALLQANLHLFSDVPPDIEEAENERLCGMPPRDLKLTDDFRVMCDQRGAQEPFAELQRLLATVVALEEGDPEAYRALVEACRSCLEVDNYDQAMSFAGSTEMFEGHDRSIIVKLLLAAVDYDAFCSMMREESLESDYAEANPDAAGSLFVLGTQAPPSELQQEQDQ